MRNAAVHSSKRLVSTLALAFCIFIGPQSFAQSGQTVYTDSLQNSWEDWSWATVNLTNAFPVHGGSRSISVFSRGFEALYFHHSAQNASQFASISLWVNGGAGGQTISMRGATNGSALTNFVVLAPLTTTWRQETIPLAALGVANAANFDGFWLQAGGGMTTFYVDDVTLITNATPPATVALTSPAAGSSFAAPATIALAATVTTNSHTINRVEFRGNGLLLGEDFTPPYAFNWTNVGAGSYSLSARVYFDQGTGSAGNWESVPFGITVVTNLIATITVDAQKNRRAINPTIYGVAFASSNQVAELNAPLNRSGGNAETRYNWQLNAHNRGSDWYFQSLADSSSVPGTETDNFIGATKNAGAEPMVTVPMIGWAPKLGPGRGRLSSYSIAKYGPQTGNDFQYFPDAGNGISVTNNTPITWNNPLDANFPTNSTFQQEWIRHLTNRWGLSAGAGVRFYCMDNEHSLWQATHRDVHPVGPTMQEIRDKFFDYGEKVKAVDPGALLLAPEEWGWSGYFWSGYDQQWSGQNNDFNPSHFPDRGTNGGWDYLPWFLDQAHQHATTTGQRLLDVFTVHFYPQGGEFSDDISTTMQERRNRSTRALWDTNYVDQTWINSVVKLIPRIQGWVATYYPGTDTGITEYNWGAENHINGATTQADIFGIFGREGLDYATRWTTPGSGTPTFKAMKLFRNYDGNDSAFGDTSVSAAGPNPDLLATFAAVRSSDGAMTIMAINKQLNAAAAATFSLTNFPAGGSAQVWQLTSANTIAHLSDLNFTGNSFSNLLSAQSITLFVIPPLAQPVLRDAETAPGSSIRFWLEGQAGQRYAILSSSNFVNWSFLQTNLLSSNSILLTVPATNAQRFYRAQWVP